MSSIKREQKITIYGTGQQKRNFLYIDDAIRSIESALNFKGNDEVFNIADDCLYSVNDLIKILKSKGLEFEANYEKTEESNLLQVLCEDVTKARKILRWKPEVNLNEGLDEVIEKIII